MPDTQNVRLIYLVLFGWSGVEFGRIGHFEGLGSVLGLTPHGLLPAVLDRATGPHADLTTGPLNAVYTDHLFRLNPVTRTTQKRR